MCIRDSGSTRHPGSESWRSSLRRRWPLGWCSWVGSLHCSQGVPVSGVTGFGSGWVLLLALGLDESVEPGDVVLGGLGAVLDQRAGVDVETLAGRSGPVGGQAPVQLGPTALEQSEPGLGGEIAGEGEPESETPGVVGADRLFGVDQLFEQCASLFGDPVLLAGSLGAPGGACPSGAQSGPLAAQRPGERHGRCLLYTSDAADEE